MLLAAFPHDLACSHRFPLETLGFEGVISSGIISDWRSIIVYPDVNVMVYMGSSWYGHPLRQPRRIKRGKRGFQNRSTTHVFVLYH